MLIKTRRSAQPSGRLARFVCLSIFLSCASFRIEPTIHDLAEQTQIKLNSLHSVDPLIRKYEVSLSDEGFLRYRKTLLNGKQEYYSCNVSKLKSIDYLGNTMNGNLRISTMADDVIVQTYNDREGNIDSMATALSIPLTSLEAEDLNAVQHNLLEIKRMLH